MPPAGGGRVDLFQFATEEGVRIVPTPPRVNGFEHAREGKRGPFGMVGQQHRCGFLDVFHQESIEASVGGNVRCVRLEHQVPRHSLFQSVQQPAQAA